MGPLGKRTASIRSKAANFRGDNRKMRKTAPRNAIYLSSESICTFHFDGNTYNCHLLFGSD